MVIQLKKRKYGIPFWHQTTFVDFVLPGSWEEMSAECAREILWFFLTSVNEKADIVQQQIKIIEIICKAQLEEYDVQKIEISLEGIAEWIEQGRLSELAWLFEWERTDMPYDFLEVKDVPFTRDLDFQPNQLFYLCSDGFGNIRAFEMCLLLDYLSVFARLQKMSASEKQKTAIEDVMWLCLAVVARPRRNRQDCEPQSFQFDCREELNKFEHKAFVFQRKKLFKENLPSSVLHPFFQALVFQLKKWHRNFDVFNSKEEKNDNNGAAPNMSFGKNKGVKWEEVLNAFSDNNPATRKYVFDMVHGDFLTILHQQKEQK